MSSNNRGDRIQLLQKVLKKYFKPQPVAESRSVLEQLLFAGCLENARHDAAEEAFQRLQELYFDWNEVRVTTITELGDALRGLPDAADAAARIKRGLQSIFEARYSFDLEDMRKMNQGKAIQELAKFVGVTPFMLGYVVQHAFGGHTIPVSQAMMTVLLMTGIVTPSEAEKHQTPGLERAIPKSKGHEFASCLQQLAAEHFIQPTNKNIKAILKEAGAVELPKPEPPKPMAAKPKKAEPAALESKTAESKNQADKKVESKKPELKKPELKKPELKKPESKEVKGKPVEEVPVSKTSKPVVAAKPAKADKSTKDVKSGKGDKPAPSSKGTKDGKPTKVTPPAKKPLTSKKPPQAGKKLGKSKPATGASKKPVVKKITKRKPK